MRALGHSVQILNKKNQKLYSMGIFFLFLRFNLKTMDTTFVMREIWILSDLLSPGHN